MDKLLLTVDEAAKVLSVKRSHVYTLIKSRELKTIQLGTARRVPVSACWELVNGKIEAEASK